MKKVTCINIDQISGNGTIYKSTRGLTLRKEYEVYGEDDIHYIITNDLGHKEQYFLKLRFTDFVTPTIPLPEVGQWVIFDYNNGTKSVPRLILEIDEHGRCFDSEGANIDLAHYRNGGYRPAEYSEVIAFIRNEIIKYQIELLQECINEVQEHINIYQGMLTN